MFEAPEFVVTCDDGGGKLRLRADIQVSFNSFCNFKFGIISKRRVLKEKNIGVFFIRV